MSQTEPSPSGDQEVAAQIPVIWRVVALVIAVVVIGAILWPILNRQSGDTVSDVVPTQPPVVDDSQTTEIEPVTPVNEDNSSDSSVDSSAIPTDIEAEESPTALFQLGQTYYQQGAWDNAIDAYQKATSLDPDYQAAFVNLGDAYYQSQNLDAAIEAYEQAIELVPDDAEVIYNLGAAYFQQALASGQANESGLQEAITQIERAIDLNPTLPQPYYGLAAAYQVLGDADQAIENYEKFLELDDGSDQLATNNATQFLEQLKATQNP